MHLKRVKKCIPKNQNTEIIFQRVGHLIVKGNYDRVLKETTANIYLIFNLKVL